MGSDPIWTLAAQRIIKASAELDVQIADMTGGSPVIEILRILKQRAADSLNKIAFLNIYDPKDRLAYVTLQNEIKRYDEFFGAIKEIVHNGIELDRRMQDDEREELLDLLMKEGRTHEAIELGLIDPPEASET